jgi:hypothetical protein
MAGSLLPTINDEFRKLSHASERVFAEYVWIGGTGLDLRSKTYVLYVLLVFGGGGCFTPEQAYPGSPPVTQEGARQRSRGCAGPVGVELRWLVYGPGAWPRLGGAHQVSRVLSVCRRARLLHVGSYFSEPAPC